MAAVTFSLKQGYLVRLFLFANGLLLRGQSRAKRQSQSSSTEDEEDIVNTFER